jgi:outer membrane protein TolC
MSQTLRSILVVGLLFACPGPMWGQTPAAPFQAPLTVQQLLDAALANNRSLKIAEAHVAKAEADANAASKRQFPALNTQLFGGPVSEFDFLFPAGVFGTFPTTGPIPPSDAKVNSPSKFATLFQFQATQPLTPLFRIRANLHQLEYERDVMQERRRARAQAISSDVRRQYYAVLEAQSAVMASDAAVNYYKELYRVARDQQDAKTAFEADTLAVQAELTRRQYVGTTLKNQLATVKQQLGITVGREIDADLPFAPAEGVSTMQVDLASAQARALKQRPEIREAQLRVQQAQQAVDARRAERIPDLNVTMRFLGLNNIEVLPPTVAAVGVQASWDIFDWGRKRSEIAASERARTEAELSLVETQAQIRLDVDVRYRQLMEARELIGVADVARKAAGERLRLTRARFDAQSALRGDVLQAEASMAEAERDYRRAVLASLTAEADLQRAIGEM